MTSAADATLVGGSAAALYPAHRTSFDHDHVVGDLHDRFDAVLEALESDPEWVTNRVRPGKIILGQLGDIEAGVRQMLRTTPLEVREVTLQDGSVIRVPTQEETLRIKAYLAVKRNQTRDFLDIATSAHRYGHRHAARTLTEIDQYYTDPHKDGSPVADQIARQLADPQPKDSRTMARLSQYKGLKPRWHSWEAVTVVLGEVAHLMLQEGAG